MRDLLDQLYKTKLQLLAVLSTVGGIALLLLARWTDTMADTGWLSSLPLTDLGSALFTTGLLAIAFEYIDRRRRSSRHLYQVTPDPGVTPAPPEQLPSRLGYLSPDLPPDVAASNNSVAWHDTMWEFVLRSSTPNRSHSRRGN